MGGAAELMVNFAKLLNQPPKPPPIVPQLIIAITGHRPHKLASHGTVTATKPNGDGYEWGNPLRVALRERIREETERLLARPRGPRGKMSAMHLDSYLHQVKWADGFTPGLDPIALSGVALGIDQDACGVWFRMGLPTNPPVTMGMVRAGGLVTRLDTTSGCVAGLLELARERCSNGNPSISTNQGP